MSCSSSKIYSRMKKLFGTQGKTLESCHRTILVGTLQIVCHADLIILNESLLQQAFFLEQLIQTSMCILKVAAQAIHKVLQHL